MSSFDKYRIVDLSPRLVGTLKKLNGEILEGTREPFGVPWPLEEARTVNMDDSNFTAVGGWPDDPVFPYKINGHFGIHTEGGKGHIDHWEGIPDNMMGLWEYPLETFMGPAAVCDFSALKPVEKRNEKGDTVLRGQAITPEHLSNVQKGDIVLMHSPYRGAEQPYLPAETTEWLYEKGLDFEHYYRIIPTD